MSKNTMTYNNNSIFLIISHINKAITTLFGIKLLGYMVPLIFPSILYIINRISFRTMILYYIGLGFIMALIKIGVHLLKISILSKLVKNHDDIVEYCRSLSGSKSQEAYYISKAMKALRKSIIILVDDQTGLDEFHKEIDELIDIIDGKKISEA